MGNLANLRDAVPLSGTELIGEIPAALGNLTNLKSLDTSGERIKRLHTNRFEVQGGPRK